MIASYPDRTFRLWAYTVSHSTLLVRSVASPANPHNIDVVFYDVGLLQLPTTLVELTISEERGRSLEGPPEGSQHRTTYVLESEGRTHIVEAAKCRVSQNTVDRFDGGPLWPFPGSLSPFDR